MTYKQGFVNPNAVHSEVSKNSYGRKITVEEVLGFPIVGIPERGITMKTCEHFGVRAELSEEDQKVIAHYFPYTEAGEITGFKKVDLTKNKKDKWRYSTVGRVGLECDLFGASVANKTGGGRVFVTEGEYDSLVCWEVLREESTGSYRKGNPAVVSIGLGTAHAVRHMGSKENTRFLKKFNKLILAFDNDTVTPVEKAAGIKRGREAASEVYGLFPDLLMAILPEGEDPCQMAQEHGRTQLYWSLQKPMRYTPEGFITFEEAREEAIKPSELGRDWPWPSLMKQTFGRRDGEGYYIGAGVKMGKSTFLDKLVEHITTVERREDSSGNMVRRKAALFKFEEKPAQTLKKVAGKLAKKDFCSPAKRIFVNDEGLEHDIWGDPIPANLRHTFYTTEQLEEGIDRVGDTLILYNNYGRCDWDTLKSAIRHAVLVEHVKDVFIDPITKLTTSMTPSEANTELTRFADELSTMANDLQFTYYCFCHLLSPDYGKKHEFGGKVQSAQMRGSRAMIQFTNYTMGLEGDKDPDLCPRQRNTRWLVILDDREHGNTCRIPLFYDEHTGDFIEPPRGFLEQEDEMFDLYGNYQTHQTLAEWFEANPKGSEVSLY